MFGKHLVRGVVFVATVSVAAFCYAGDYHNGLSLVCADCHVMHFSQSHPYNGTGFTPLGPNPQHFLLRDKINDLCLTCHDNSALAPDVLEAHSNGYVRQAGGLNLETGGDPAYPTTAGHTLGSTENAPGSNPVWNNPDGLNCVNCHGAHGAGAYFGPDWTNSPTGSYRNLGGYGTAVGSGVGIPYTWGANDLSVWVFEDQNGGTTAGHYGVGSITFNEPNTDRSTYAEVCKGCHTNFHGDAGDANTIGGTLVGSHWEEFIRHPNLTSDIGAIGGGHSNLDDFTDANRVNQVHVMSPTGQRAGSYDGTDAGLTPSCMSCHKGHGNKNPFGLIYMVGDGPAVTEEGDGVGSASARDLCKQCHGQGTGLFTPAP